MNANRTMRWRLEWVFLAAAALTLASAGRAADPQGKPPSREEWINKIAKDIQASESVHRAKLEEMRKSVQSQAGKQAAALQPSSAVDLALKNVSDVAVAYFDPGDCVVAEGSLFQTHVMLRCRAQRSFNVVDLVFSFDPMFVIPCEVHDDGLRPHVAQDPVFETDVASGQMRYRARFDEPMDFFTQRLLTIVWKALKPTDCTIVSLSSPLGRSSVRLGDKDLLTDDLLTQGALLSLGLSIEPRASSVKRGLLPAGPAAARALPYFTNGKVWLELAGPDQPVGPGEEFDVRIFLHNPDKAVIDTLSLFLRFPPERLEILDWDLGNWVRTGVNIHDAPAHELFPFDFHLANEVDRKTGEIFYRMGVSHGRISSEGLVAETRARAIQPASVRDFEFVKGPEDSLKTTEVSLLGMDLLDWSHGAPGDAR